MSEILTSDEYRVRLCDWLTANGVNVGLVPIDAKATYWNGRLVIEMFRHDANGTRISYAGNPSPRVTATFEVTTPPPDVAGWLS